jgi:hypothetical protein
MRTYTSQTGQASSSLDHRKEILDKRLAALFWPLTMILIGGLWMLPAGTVPGGTWLVGIGLILLGLNAARMLNGIPARPLPTVLGALALAAGLAELAGANLPLVPLTLIALGTSIVLELFHTRKT